jgi:preprotein translocase subunit SecD
VLVGFIVVVYGLIAAGVTWSSAQWTPKLALDLEGGTEIVLTPVPQAGASGKITQATLDEAVRIIRQRINGTGVSEAEITTQGSQNIVVSLPGKTDQATRDSVKRAAALEFRPVLYVSAAQTAATPTPTPSGSVAGSTPSSSGSAKGAGVSPSVSPPATLKSSATPSASPSASSNGMAFPKALLAATPAPSPTGAAAATPSSSAAASAAAAKASSTPQPSPTDASDLNWVTPAVGAQFQALDCTKQANLKGAITSDPAKPMVTCSTDGQAAYVLGPAELTGTDIGTASASLETNSQGITGTAWQVNLNFKGDGPAKFAKVTQRLTNLQEPRNQFAIVLDGLVVSAPRTNEAITGGSAQITGNFTEAEAQSLANQLRFGALPISFQEQTEQTISATLGSEQLQRGLLAGLIGLALVVLYSLAQYRALGLVTIASLMIAMVITYGLVVLLGWRQGYRLSLAGVAGLIVSIGITADSFIVYFERVRDEIRDGRGLLAAVENGWARARRTILISDAVSFLAAVVLFILAIGNVRGFAFTLGLTTVVDIMVVFLFTHPMLGLISRTRFFGGGHKLSGFDAAHLGRAVTYTGRGTVRPPRPPASRERTPAGASSGTASFTGTSDPGSSRTGTTIAERRAAAAREESARAEATLSEAARADDARSEAARSGTTRAGSNLSSDGSLLEEPGSPGASDRDVDAVTDGAASTSRRDA